MSKSNSSKGNKPAMSSLWQNPAFSELSQKEIELLKYTHGSMIAFCYRKTHPKYVNYGGRGISVCDRWRSYYYYFILDMGKKPTPDHSLDRINNDGNYEPSNCRWATAVEQQNNKRNTLTDEQRKAAKKKWNNRWNRSKAAKQRRERRKLKKMVDLLKPKYIRKSLRKIGMDSSLIDDHAIEEHTYSIKLTRIRKQINKLISDKHGRSEPTANNQSPASNQSKECVSLSSVSV